MSFLGPRRQQGSFGAISDVDPHSPPWGPPQPPMGAPMGGCGGHLKGGEMGARAAASRCFSYLERAPNPTRFSKRYVFLMLRHHCTPPARPACAPRVRKNRSTSVVNSEKKKNLSLAKHCALQTTRVTPCRSYQQDPYTLRTCPPNSQGGFI